MGSEKALLKKAGADEVGEAIRRHAEGLRARLEISKGGVAAIEACVQQLQGVHRRLEEDLNKGTVSPDEYKVAKKYMAFELQLLQNMHQSMKASLPVLKNEVMALGKAVDIASSISTSHERAAEKFEREELEEEEYRKDLAERTSESPPEVETRSVSYVKADPESEKVIDEYIAGQGKASAKQRNGNKPRPQSKVSCSHCGLGEAATGSSVCVPCTSYKNRYKKLPPAHVLDARRERWEAARADS